MPDRKELETFRSVWEAETANTIRVLESIPEGAYDFRPDPAGRSIGEMAWHLAEVDACIIYGVSTMHFAYSDPVPHLEKRPREAAQLAPAFARVHARSLELLAGVTADKLDTEIQFADGRGMTVRDVLWIEILHHTIHHRGQLALLCRMAGGSPPGLYGPNREEMKELMAGMRDLS
jgi:uncharacterized damage-inducible protein DinB